MVGRAQPDDAVAARGVLALQLCAGIVPVRAPPAAATAAPAVLRLRGGREPQGAAKPRV